MGNAYDNASLIVTPNAYKASKIYALKPTDGSGDLSFSRAGSKMRRNSAGLWETIGTNIPPLSYPVGGGCPSWLFEAGRTNNLTNNTTLSGWTVVGMTLSDGVQSPILGVLSKRLTSTAATNYVLKTLSTTGTRTVTTSVFIKNVDYANNEIFYIATSDGVIGGMIMTYKPFNDTLTFANVGSWTNISIRKTAESEGFTRIEITGTVTSASAGWVEIYGVNGRSVDITAVQNEIGSYATSPIITAGASVTRLRDVPQNFTSINGLTNFSVFFDITPTLLNNTMLFGSYSGGGTNSYLYYTTSNSYLKRKDGTELNMGTHGMTLGTRYKVGYVISGTTIKYFRNGALIFTYTIDGTLFDLASIWSSKDGGGSILPISGICKDSILYQTALSDSEAIELTTL